MKSKGVHLKNKWVSAFAAPIKYVRLHLCILTQSKNIRFHP